MNKDLPTFRLEGPSTPWGDYGDILLHGMSCHIGRTSAGTIQLERTGPYVPPISFPGIGDIVVTDEFRTRLKDSGLRGFTFAPVKLARIVKYNWHLWNPSADEPQEYPKGGEPESYILARRHSPLLAAQIGPLWELVPKRGVRHVWVKSAKESWKSDIFLESGSLRGLDFFRANNTGYNYVSKRAKDWLEANAKEHVSFIPGKFRRKKT